MQVLRDPDARHPCALDHPRCNRGQQRDDHVPGHEKVCTRAGWCMLKWVSLSCTPWCPWQQFIVTLGRAIARKTEAEHVESGRLLGE
eukprot:9382968-Heterocapsa_arctica.AAC.1